MIIKFRAWRDGDMIYQDDDSKASVAHFFNRIYEQHPVMQFTGLKDKNGKEIYEGDIFRIEEDADELDEQDKMFYVVITWVKEWAMFSSLLLENEYKEYISNGIKALDEPMFWSYTLEDTDSRKHFLCGNVYENPELLKP